MLSSSRKTLLATALATAAVLAAPHTVLAQSQSINGTIRGRAVDPTGASLPGATVTITNPALGVTRTAQTGSDGYYTFINLPLGTYSVAFTASGFATLTVAQSNSTLAPRPPSTAT